MKKALLVSKHANKFLVNLYSAVSGIADVSTAILCMETDKITYPYTFRINCTPQAIAFPHIAYKPFIDLVRQYDAVLSTNDPFHKELISCLAAKSNITPINDIFEIKGNTVKRFMYSGRIVSTLQINSKPLIGTIKSTEFQKSTHKCNNIKSVSDFKEAIESIKYIGAHTNNIENDLDKASIVLCGGRGLGKQENFDKLFKLAKKIGPHCAVGGTRVAVDSGYLGNNFQIGQTGRSICSDIYIGFGVSGSLQHMAGIKNCKKIIAVNKDQEANIIKYCDNYIIDDAEKVLNELL